MAVSMALISTKDLQSSPIGDAPREETVKRQPPLWSKLHCLIADLLQVKDYGVRLPVRVGILSPLASTRFRVFLLYTVSRLLGGSFHRTFLGFFAP
jgi:hypothetical protein